MRIVIAFVPGLLQLSAKARWRHSWGDPWGPGGCTAGAGTRFPEALSNLSRNSLMIRLCSLTLTEVHPPFALQRRVRSRRRSVIRAKSDLNKPSVHEVVGFDGLGSCHSNVDWLKPQFVP